MYGSTKQAKSPKLKSKKSKQCGKVKEKERNISNLDINTNLYSLNSTKSLYGRKFIPVKIIGKLCSEYLFVIGTKYHVSISRPLGQNQGHYFVAF